MPKQPCHGAIVPDPDAVRRNVLFGVFLPDMVMRQLFCCDPAEHDPVMVIADCLDKEGIDMVPGDLGSLGSKDPGAERRIMQGSRHNDCFF